MANSKLLKLPEVLAEIGVSRAAFTACALAGRLHGS